MTLSRKALLALLLTLSLALVTAEERVHVLGRGETLYTLSRRYGVAVEALQEHNGIADPTRLQVGASIRIPGTYVVAEGDYIYSIARRLGVDWRELLEMNHLQADDVVRPGDVLLLPASATVAVAQRDQTASDGGTADTGTGTTTGAQDRSATAAAVQAPPAQVRLEWPHPGARETVDGKFPGVAMKGSAGDAFRSIAPGVVTFVGPYGTFGRIILIRGRDGYLFGYAGADRIDVKVGDRVEPGTVLGTLGPASAFDSPSLLLSVWKNYRYVDPETAPRG